MMGLAVADALKGTEYHKINAPFKRDDKGVIQHGDWCREEYEYLKDLPWVWTEKIDGTNIRVIWSGGKVTFGGRTERAQIQAPLMSHLVETFTPEKMEAVFPNTWAVLYGEGYGAGIQKGGIYRPDQAFILFDVLVSGWYLKRPDVDDVAAKLGVDSVAERLRGSTLSEAIGCVAVGVASVHTVDESTFAEGLVGTPACGLYGRDGSRIIVKVKHKDFYKGEQ